MLERPVVFADTTGRSNIFIYRCHKWARYPNGLHAKRYAEEEVELLVAWVGGEACEDGKVVFLLDDEILGGAKANVGDAETVSVVERGGIRHGTQRGCPVERGEAEGCRELKIAAVGALTVFVEAVVASEIGEPLHAEKTEVVADINLPDMGGLPTFVLEIAVFGEPIVGDADIEAYDVVSQREVHFLVVGEVADAYVAPS